MNQQSVSGRVNIAVALNCEARPLIERYRLKLADASAGYSIYQNNDGISLIITGVGKMAMASACGYLAGSQANQHSDKAAWLNLGIAGHQTIAVGELIRIGKIVDASNGKTYYPAMLLDSPCTTTTLYSVDHPESQYVEPAAYDMEASGFYSTVSRFVTGELIQVFKLVSDNPEHTVEQITKQVIQQRISAKLESIRDIVSQLQLHCAAYNGVYMLPDECISLQQSTGLSFSQRVKFVSLYRRYHALGGLNLRQKLDQKSGESAKGILRTLEILIDSLDEGLEKPLEEHL